ncbi:hypothetical protein EMPG_14985 [Blastomyces silverae]|uniref:Uncharacterized protein n=1 Tax=Blastomyces silverae TaxID=2060906 RepID=A0A0H1BEZ6_9EURO|nr:hypothetical protein EMPG_14985 [Blastomyces silverae]
MSANDHEPFIQAKFTIQAPLQIGRCAHMSIPIVVTLDSFDHDPPSQSIKPHQFDGCEIRLEIRKEVNDDFEHYQFVERSKEIRSITQEEDGSIRTMYVAVFQDVKIQDRGTFRMFARSYFKIDGVLEYNCWNISDNIWVLNDDHPEIRPLEDGEDDIRYLEENYQRFGMTEEELEKARSLPQYLPVLSVTLAPNPGGEPTH